MFVFFEGLQLLIKVTRKKNMNKELILSLKSKYPFGMVPTPLQEGTEVFVKKQLHYKNNEEYDMIKQIIHFVKTVKHPFLVNLLKVQQSTGLIKIIYEYVPFRVEGWVTSINQELLDTLQDQMIELAQYLCRASLKFTFDPEALGLNQEMNIKYFLSGFQVDANNWEHNLEENKRQIYTFFKQLTLGIDKFEEGEKQMMESISTNGSLSHTDAVPKLLNRRQTAKDILNIKISDSKKRCQEVIDRFRKMNMKI